jgi:hypothetical protein
MVELTPAQTKCLEALRSYGKPFPGGNLAFARTALPGFKIGPAEALLRKGLVQRVFNDEDQQSYYSIKN